MHKPHGKYKPKIYNIYSHTKEKKFRHSTKNSHLITRKYHKRRTEQKATSKQFQNNEQEANKYMPIKNYFKCNWTKCLNCMT